MDSHLARFGRMKWKLFYRYAYCRMAGKKRAFVPISVPRLCTVNRNINRYTSQLMRRFH